MPMDLFSCHAPLNRLLPELSIVIGKWHAQTLELCGAMWSQADTSAVKPPYSLL